MADVNIDINIVASQALASLKRIESQVSKSTTSFSGLSRSVIALNQGFQLVKSFVGAATGAIGSFINQAKDIEQIEAQFQVFTKSTETAKVLLEDLQQFAATTPFQLPGLANATKTLLSFGSTSEEVIPRLKFLGDAAAATGKDLGELALIFGQVQAAGKLTGERLLQLQERGINVLPVLAEQLGTTQEAVRGLVSAGKIDFATFEEAFKSLSEEGGLFFEGMIKQSKTLGGVLSTLDDNISLVAADIGKQLLPFVKDAAIAIIQWIQANKELIVSGVKVFIEGISSAIRFLVKVVDVAVESFKTMVGFISENATLFQALGVGLGAAAVALGIYTVAANASAIATGALAAVTAGYNVVVGIATTATSAFTAVLAVLTSPIGLIVAAVGALGAGIFLLAKNWTLVTAKTKEWTASVIEFALPAIDAFLSGVGAIVSIFSKDMAAAIEGQKEKIRSISETLREESEVQLEDFRLKKELENEIIEEDNAVKEEEASRHSTALLKTKEKQTEAELSLMDKILKGGKGSAADLFDFEKNTNAGRAANLKSTLNTIATLSESNNKTLGAIGKAAAISTATIDGIVAVQKALASGSPPYNFILAAITGVAAAANVAKISGVKGFQDGGIVGGNSTEGDRVPALVNSGELILNRAQQDNVADQLTSGITVNISGDVVSEDAFIDKVVDGINNGTEFRNLQLRSA